MTGKERFSSAGLFPQTPAISKAGPGPDWEPGTPSWSLTEVAGTQVAGQSFAAFSGALAGKRHGEVGQLELCYGMQTSPAVVSPALPRHPLLNPRISEKVASNSWSLIVTTAGWLG